jgi:hypothetical protein
MKKKISELNNLLIKPIPNLLAMATNCTNGKILKDVREKMISDNCEEKEIVIALRITKLSLSFIRFFMKKEDKKKDIAECYFEWQKVDGIYTEFISIIKDRDNL